MKKLVLSLIAFTALTLSAQDKIQWSTVREQNSNKRPIPNAQVIFSDAAPASSDQNGKLRLVFKDKKPGTYVFLTEVQKAGYELVNNKEIEQVKLSEGDQFGVDIILAKTGFVEASKKEYYGISDKSLKAGFEREKAKLRGELQAVRITAQQFEKKNEQLQLDYDRQQKELSVWADKFARVNFDDVSPVYREALELFKIGQVDRAIAKLESVNPAKRTEATIKEQNRIVKAQTELNSQKIVLENEKRQQIANLRLLADMYSLRFDLQKAETQYDDLLRIDSTDLKILIDAAEYYRLTHRYEKALKAYLLAIAHPQIPDLLFNIILGHIGDLHTATGNTSEALIMYEKFLNVFKSSLNVYPENDFFKRNIALSYERIGSINYELGNLQQSLNYFEKYSKLSMELCLKLPKNLEYKNALAIAYERLGTVHTAVGKLNLALFYYQEKIKLSKNLNDSLPNNLEYKYGLAISNEKIGETYQSMGDLEQASFFFQRHFELLKELYTDYPHNVELKNGLAVAYHKQGTICMSLDKLNKALGFFQKEVRLLEELHSALPLNVEFKNNLAIAYLFFGDILKNRNYTAAFGGAVKVVN